MVTTAVIEAILPSAKTMTKKYLDDEIIGVAISTLKTNGDEGKLVSQATNLAGRNIILIL